MKVGGEGEGGINSGMVLIEGKCIAGLELQPSHVCRQDFENIINTSRPDYVEQYK